MLDSFKQASLSAKVLTLSGLIILLSFGLCGTAFANALPSRISGYFGVLGFYVLILGIFGVVVGTIVAIVENFRNP